MDFTRCERLTPRGRAFLLAVEAICREHGICLAVDGHNPLVLVPFAKASATVCAFTILDALGHEEVPGNGEAVPTPRQQGGTLCL